METKIIINLFGKMCAAQCTPIIIEVKEFKSYKDAMEAAKFKASKINKREFDVVITTL